MGKKKQGHVVLGNNSLRCLNCGDEHHLDLASGISLRMMAGLAEGYSKDHRSCKPSSVGRARFEYTTPEQWAKSWDTGQSSMTIYNFMARGIVSRPEIPHDPSDFGRCYRLLKVAPEWRARMAEMGAVIATWTPYADAWDELERLFEEESPTGMAPILFARLQELARC